MTMNHKDSLYIFIIISFVTLTYGSDLLLEIENKCDKFIYPAISGVNLEDKKPINLTAPPGLSKNESCTVTVAAPWSGRVWGRSDCNGTGSCCAVGDCGARDCDGRSSKNVTLAELSFDNDTVWGDISIVDAHSQPLSITFPGSEQCESRSCPVPAWLGLLGSKEVPTAVCPSDNIWLKGGKSLPPSYVINSSQVAGCLSNCTLLGTDAACCTGNYSSPSVCKLDPNPVLAQACPQAYSYAFSDGHRDVLSTCSFKNGTKPRMTITFCPVQ